MKSIGHEELVAQLRAVAEPTRLRLVALLWASELTVSDLISILDQSQPRISRHLKLMFEAGVLERSQEGTRAFFRVPRDEAVSDVLSAAFSKIDKSDPVFAEDQRKLLAIRENRARTAEAYFASNAERWDELRALHLSEDKVEAAMLEMAGEGPFSAFLDIGTGTGRMLRVFADRYERALGVDRSAEMLAIARAKLEEDGVENAELRQGNIFDMAKSNAPQGAVLRGEYDLAVIHMVLHFLDQPVEALKAAGKSLAPGGKLLVVDFAPHDFEFLRAAHNHVRSGFSHAEISQLASEAGLQVVEARDLASGDGADEGLTVTIWTMERPKSGNNPWT